MITYADTKQCLMLVTHPVLSSQLQAQSEEHQPAAVAAQPLGMGIAGTVCTHLFKLLSSLSLLGDTDCASTPASGLAVLPLDTQAPVMPQATVIPAEASRLE